MEEGFPIKRTSLKPFLVISVTSAGVLNVENAMVQHEECMRKMCCLKIWTVWNEAMSDRFSNSK